MERLTPSLGSSITQVSIDSSGLVKNIFILFVRWRAKTKAKQYIEIINVLIQQDLEGHEHLI